MNTMTSLSTRQRIDMSVKRLKLLRFQSNSLPEDTTQKQRLLLMAKINDELTILRKLESEIKTLITKSYCRRQANSAYGRASSLRLISR